MSKFTVIDGKTGESHEWGIAPISKVCKSGLIINFAGTQFERLPGVAMLDASELPPVVIMALVALAVGKMGEGASVN